jgi:hypothetical protein
MVQRAVPGEHGRDIFIGRMEDMSENKRYLFWGIDKFINRTKIKVSIYESTVK